MHTNQWIRPLQSADTNNFGQLYFSPRSLPHKAMCASLQSPPRRGATLKPLFKGNFGSVYAITTKKCYPRPHEVEEIACYKFSVERTAERVACACTRKRRDRDALCVLPALYTRPTDKQRTMRGVEVCPLINLFSFRNSLIIILIPYFAPLTESIIKNKYTNTSNSLFDLLLGEK